MIKYTIPALLTGLVMIAGIFAILPVYEASTVHLTLQGDAAQLITISQTGIEPGTGGQDQVVFTIGQAFIVHNIVTTRTNDANNDCDMDAAVVSTNLIATTEITEPNPGTTAADGDQENLIDLATAGDTNVIFGSTTLIVQTNDAGACDADDSFTISAVIETRGDVTPGGVGIVVD